MPLADGDFVQATVTYSFPESSQMQNVFHWRIDGAEGAIADEADAISALDYRLSMAYGEIDAMLSTSLTTFQVSWDVVHWDGDHWAIFYHMGNSVLSITPAAAGDLLPPANCALIVFYPIYYRHQGRKYIGGFSEVYNAADGAMLSSLQSALMDFADDLVGEWVTILGTPTPLGAEFVILNRSDNLYNSIIGWGTNENWCVQRRRKQYVGS